MSLRVVVLGVSVSLASRWHRKPPCILPPSITRVLTALLLLSPTLMGSLPLRRGSTCSVLFPSHKARALLLCQSSPLKCQFMRISCTMEVSSAQLYQASEQRGRLPDHSSPWGKEVQWWGLGQPKHRSSTGIAIVRSPLLVRNE